MSLVQAQELSAASENVRLADPIKAQLQQALLASEADRAAGLDAIRTRDAAIEILRAEVARLEQIVNIA
ncbi:hypothetical protein [Bradyrhizobium sp. USDA 4454]